MQMREMEANKLSGKMEYKSETEEGIVHLWDLPEDKVHIKIKDGLRERIFQEAIDLAGNKTKLANMLGLKKGGYGYIREYQQGIHTCSLKIIKNLVQLCGRSDILELIEKNISEIKFGCKVGKSVKNPKFPFILSDKLSSLAGHSVGDGGIGLGEARYIPHYTNKSPALLKNFKNLLSSFGDMEIKKYRNIFDADFLRAPSIVGVILVQMFGSFTRENKVVPKSIQHSGKKNKSAFLRALFDDEATVDVSGHKIGILMKDKPVIEGARKMFKELGIRAGKITKKEGKYWRFRITGKKDLEEFQREIGFSHPEKKKKLNRLLNNYKIDQYKNGEIRKIMMAIIQKERSINPDELARRLERSPRGRFKMHLYQLEREKKIKWNRKENIIQKYVE